MNARNLIVAVRGWTNTGEFLLFGRPGGDLPNSFVNALQENLTDSEVWAPELDLSMFSMRSAESLSRELFGKIDEKAAQMPQLESIIILAYSAGSLLARRVFCMAHGADPSGKLSNSATSWAHKIDRMVILAGITRGWEYSTASPAHVRFLAPVLYRITLAVGRFKRKGTDGFSNTPFIWQLKRGSPFVISTRIQYINVLQALRESGKQNNDRPFRVNGLPSTVFLLGAKDEFLSPADCTELGPRDEFAFVELPRSTHAEAIQISGSNPEAVVRSSRLVAAVSSEIESLAIESWAVPASDIDDYLDPMDIVADDSGGPESGTTVERVVIVIHGIRDNGFWTKRVAREIKSLGRRNNISVRAPTPSYGFFSMWDFVKPGGRQNAAYWFMERYADVKSHFPKARVSFVGHSNGTYIAARALELCPAVNLERVVFAGSVVRCKFNWSRFRGRVKGVLNYVGNNDGVVAFLPAVFELLRIPWLDVGGAGAFGFGNTRHHDQKLQRDTGPTKADRDAPPVDVYEYQFIRGGHGAAVSEGYWPEIAEYILLDKLPERETAERKKSVRILFRGAPFFTLLGSAIVVTLLTLPLILLFLLTTRYGATLEQSLTIAFAAAGGFFISWLTGRFLRMW
ncbi:MAG: hypothetical protein QNK18_03240 [Gammaproteobacteria bacterium]|nr:hypothetical protein [Gammaproteobacteria bacterium]